AIRNVLRIYEALEIGIREGGGIGVVTMKYEHLLVQPERLVNRRICIRRLDLPSDESVGWIKDRTAGGYLECVLRFGGRLFAGAVKSQRFLSDEIVERRPVSVRHRSLFQQII